MLKYPHIKKNAQHSCTPPIPRFDNRIVRPYNKPMKYYYVMCQEGSYIHRAYVRLDTESADILHDALEARYDVCQVCAVKRSEVDTDLLIN
jgi:hypothetical protein